MVNVLVKLMTNFKRAENTITHHTITYMLKDIVLIISINEVKFHLIFIIDETVFFLLLDQTILDRNRVKMCPGAENYPLNTNLESV